MDKIYDVITLFQTTFILRKLRVTTFAEIIEIVTIFIKKKSLKTLKKLKELEAIKSI